MTAVLKFCSQLVDISFQSGKDLDCFSSYTSAKFYKV